jgi:hypothetical protein
MSVSVAGADPSHRRADFEAGSSFATAVARTRVRCRDARFVCELLGFHECVEYLEMSFLM